MYFTVLPSRSDFEYMMSRLPVYVSVEEINEMFAFADKDKDGKISYQEFLVRELRRKNCNRKYF